MNYSIRKGETYILGDGKRLKFTGGTLHRHHLTACFLLMTDVLERVVVRNIDNRDCMYISDVLHFSSKDIYNDLINDILKEVT